MSETYETFQEFSDRYWNRVRATPEFQWRMANFRWCRAIHQVSAVQTPSHPEAAGMGRRTGSASLASPSPRHMSSWEKTCRNEWARLRAKSSARAIQESGDEMGGEHV
jgi:hypothetical protein